MTEKTSTDQVRAIAEGYTFSGASIALGAALVDGQVHADAPVRLPLAMMNRHGLVAGATGTGKTKTLQLMAEQLSAAGVPVFLADIKGDLSGLSAPGTPNERITARASDVGMDWSPASFPVEYYALGGDGTGVPLRARVSSFGPILLSRIMDLNETQESSLQLIFHWADQQGLELYDLKDLRAVITHLTSPEGKESLAELGGLSKATAGVILRELVGLEADGMEKFFGEPEFDSKDVLRTAADGRGVISCLELPTVQTKPALFSTFLMWLLADLFADLPEVGDVDKPKLVFFFDEAHLLFKDASPAFLDSILTTVRLIRSKGVGIFFVTQTPKDVPGDVLGQLANRVQHALRAFTPDDAKALKATVATFPVSPYDLTSVLTSAGTGEAVITVMNERGAPTPVAWTRMIAPRSLMGPAPADAMQATVAASPGQAAYGTPVDSPSAYEKLNARTTAPASSGGAPAGGTDTEAQRIEEQITREPERREPERARSAPRPAHNPLLDVAADIAGQVGREFVRGLFGTRRRRR
ncbi:helicase HerA-like domain-containing protein [Tersicoccus sp. MR15.9]|uniref:helicase HerA-like domain-containing protein n=1 Tax=Tersicoccus mangrovi TaxID=3121635 RepID=UPI002FE607A8